MGYQLRRDKLLGLTVRLSKGGRLSRSWFDKALLSVAEGLTTNGLTSGYPGLGYAVRTFYKSY